MVLLMFGCPADDGGGTGEDEETGVPLPMGDGDGDGDQTGDGDGDQTGDGDGDGDGDSLPDCGMVQITPEYTPPNVMLVVDASGSMVANSWDHDLDPNTPTQTRWKTLYGVADSVLAQYGPAMNAGVQRFPSEAACDQGGCYNTTACIVSDQPEVGVGFDNGATILAALPSADDMGESVEGGTPATKGINSAVAHLQAQSPEIARYILLITDGAANCTPELTEPADVMELYDETLAPTVQAAFDDDAISTFVVGIDIVDALIGAGPDGSPEANPFERLNEVALAGGAPKNMGMGAEKFFNATNQDELLMAIGGIIDEITECVIDLNEYGSLPDPIQIPYVSFTADGQEVPGPVTDCENEDGWAWVEEGVIVTFCGSYCADFKIGGSVIDGKYECPPMK